MKKDEEREGREEREESEKMEKVVEDKSGNESCVLVPGVEQEAEPQFPIIEVLRFIGLSVCGSRCQAKDHGNRRNPLASKPHALSLPQRALLGRPDRSALPSCLLRAVRGRIRCGWYGERVV